MERANTTHLEGKLKSVNQLIREAEEIRERGELAGSEEVNRLKRQRDDYKGAMRTAVNKDYVIDRNRRREKRSKFKKAVDTLTMNA